MFSVENLWSTGPARPDHPTEKGRIEAAGGSVSFEEMAGDGAEDGAESPEFSRKMLEKCWKMLENDGDFKYHWSLDFGQSWLKETRVLFLQLPAVGSSARIFRRKFA